MRPHPFTKRQKTSLKPFVTFRRLGQFGRLGNQLFQVAAVIGVARKNDCDFMLPRWEAARDLCGVLAFHDRIPHARTHVERTFHYSEIRIASPVDLCGFFQSERYFQHCAAEIRRAFAPAAEIEEAITRRLAPLLERGPVCSVHVRRTDYVGHPVFFDLAADGYYERAFERLPAGSQFLVFSDDIPWCRERFTGSNFHFSVGASAIEDMFTMSRCHAHIIANSTLSWWGAWLDPNLDKTVIAPARWFAGPRPARRKKHRLLLPIPGVRETKDVVPEGWIKL